MTRRHPSPPKFDKFGLQVQPARPGDWVPIRDLGAQHRRRILGHLLALDPHDRYLRFGHTVSPEELSTYVASINFRRDEVFGVFGRNLELHAVAHLASMSGGQEGSHGKAMEFGVSVLPEARGKGLGQLLFEHAITHARNRGAGHLVIYALSENAPMLRIAAKAGATVERHGSDAEGWLKLPPYSVGSKIQSSLQSLAAEAIYRGRSSAVHWRDWLQSRGLLAL